MLRGRSDWSVWKKPMELYRTEAKMMDAAESLRCSGQRLASARRAGEQSGLRLMVFSTCRADLGYFTPSQDASQCPSACGPDSARGLSPDSVGVFPIGQAQWESFPSEPVELMGRRELMSCSEETEPLRTSVKPLQLFSLWLLPETEQGCCVGADVPLLHASFSPHLSVFLSCSFELL